MSDILPNSLIIQCGDRWEYVNYYSLMCFGNSDFSSSYMSISEYEYMVAMIYNMYQSSPDYAQYWYSINYNTTLYRYADPMIAFVVEYVTKDIIPTSYYLTGHGEADMNGGRSVFGGLGLTPLDTTTTDIPRDASGIVVNMPSEDFTDAERDAFLEYLAGGGQMTFFTNKKNLDMPNLSAVLSAYGMSVGDKSYVTRDVEVESENENEEVYEPTNDILLSVNYTSDVLGTIDSTTAAGITLTDVNAITVDTDGLEYPNVISLFESPSDCYLGDDKDNKASYILACAVETPNGARVVWFTGGESMTDTATGASSIVDAAIGNGQLIGNRYYYLNNEMAIDYNDNKVEFIEFLGGLDGMLKPTIYGISAFETQANDLFEVLKKQNNGMAGDHENGYSYQFENISVGVYREAVPQEVEEMIEEAASFGNPMSDDEIRYEMKRANHWATIGVGVAGYYQR